MPVLGDSISGNAGVAGATITLSGAGSATTTSASDGSYSFTGLSAGSYVVTPSMTGITFTPAFLNETIIASSITGANFVARPTGYAQTTTVTDNFHRANAPNLGANWTVTTLKDSPIAIVSNTAEANASLASSELYSGSSFPNDQFAAITVGVFTANSEVTVSVRNDVTDSTGYSAQINGFSSTWTGNISDNTTNDQIGEAFTLSGPPAPGDILSIQVVGTLVTAFYNGVPVASGTNSATASGSPVIEIDSSAVSTDTSLTLFTAGSVPNTPPTPGVGTNNTHILAAGSLFGVGNLTQAESSRTSVMGTSLGTKVIG